MTRSGKFTLTIDLGNDAFNPPQYGPELARILRELAERLEDATTSASGGVLDANGNRAGTFKITGIR